MTMAIELRRAGLNVRIIDKSDHPARHSQALVVQSRTLELFQRYGIAGEAVEQGTRLKQAQFFSEGKKLISIDLDQIESRYPYVLFLPQSKTEQILNRHLESLGVRVERGAELFSFSQTDERVLAHLRNADGDDEEFSCRWIVGCDGAHSPIRELSSIPFEGGGVSLSFFLGDLELEGPDVPGDNLAIHLSGGDVVFMGGLDNRLTRVIVALHNNSALPPDVDLSAQLRDLSIQDFQTAADHAKVNIKVRSAEWMTPFHVRDLQAKRYRVKNAFLVGDAAHIHSPVGGQGMNTGIQDAANLGWKMAAVSQGAPEELLDSYEDERAAVGRALLRFTERGLKMSTLSNPILERVRDALLPVVAGTHSAQRAILGFISETWIEYRSSHLSEDLGGDGSLRAGDRMPDIALATEQTLLGTWTSANHLAVLYNTTEKDEFRLTELLPPMDMTVLRKEELDAQGQHLFGSEPKLFLVRPDGYIGFRAPADEVRELKTYSRRVGLAGGLARV